MVNAAELSLEDAARIGTLGQRVPIVRLLQEQESATVTQDIDCQKTSVVTMPKSHGQCGEIPAALIQTWLDVDDAPNKSVEATQESYDEVFVSPSVAAVTTANDRMQRNKKMLLGFCIATPGIFILLLTSFRFDVRDTWEIDNNSTITGRCEAVLTAIEHSDDDAAAWAYARLNRLIGERTIKDESLAELVDEVHKAFVPVKRRFEQRELASAQRAEREKQRVERERLSEEVANRLRDAYFEFMEAQHGPPNQLMKDERLPEAKRKFTEIISTPCEVYGWTVFATEVARNDSGEVVVESGFAGVIGRDGDIMGSMTATFVVKNQACLQKLKKISPPC